MANVKLDWDELVNKDIAERRTKIRSMESCKWFRKIYFGTEDAN